MPVAIDFGHDETVVYRKRERDGTVRVLLAKALYRTDRRVRIVVPIACGRAVEPASHLSVSPASLSRPTHTDLERANANGGLLYEGKPRRRELPL